MGKIVTITHVRYASLKGRLLAAVLTILVVANCASFNPKLSDDAPFFGRSQTQRDGNVMVTAAVLSAAESEQAFGAKLYNKEIQPIWLRIENNDVDPMFFLPVGLDPEYFTPLEASYLNRSSSLKLNTRMDQHFYGNGAGLYIPPGESRSGFVFTNLDEGTKTFVVELLATDQELHTLAFFITVPGIRPDHTTVDFENLYPPGEIVPYDMVELRLALEQLPCCTKDKSGKNLGDPLNIAVIGTVDDVFFAFIQAGWDETETIYTASLGRTVKSFFFGGTYRYSPISALYVYGRGQDIAFQKARDTIHERNHLRLWMTNMRHDGAPVWIGQISRDVGVRFTSKTITTHKIDRDIDESRGYLLQNLWYSQFLVRYAYVSGVGEAAYDEPRVNLTGDPYFTDGLRAVMWVSSDPVSMEEVDDVQWENPAER